MEKDNLAEKAAEILAPVFDSSLNDLQKQLKKRSRAGVSTETIEAAIKFCVSVLATVQEHFKGESAELEAVLNTMTFAEIVKAYAIIGKAIEGGKTAAEIVELLQNPDAQDQQGPGAGPLPLLRSIIPTTAVINNSKLAGQITTDFLDNGEIPLLVSRKKAKKEIEIVAAMTFDNPNVKIASRQPYTAYDRAVYNAVCSLWEAGNTAFSPAMVYLAMNGLSGSAERGRKVSPQAVAAVTRSIEKQRFTRLTIDCTEQMKYYKDLKRAKFDANMLSIEGVEMTAQNGAKIKAYTFTNPNRPPVLYEYSRSIGQVISVPPRLLNSGDTINNTDEVIVLREYLIREINWMKQPNSTRNKAITYSDIYHELDIEEQSITKDKARKIRNNTEALLTHLKNEGYIKGFTEYKKGRTIAGVEIGL